MKAKIAELVLVLFWVPMLVLGQEVSTLSSNHSPLCHQVGVEAGAPSSVISSALVLAEAMFLCPAYSIGGKNMDIRLKGSYGLNYYYQVNWWLQVGARCYAEIIQNNVYADSAKLNLDHRNTMAFINIMPSVRFTYLNRPWVRLYSGVEVGLGIVAQKSDRSNQEASSSKKANPCYCSFNITPIGVCVGKQFYGLFETNIGTNSFFNVGLGCRF